MSFADALTSAAKRPGSKCGVGQALATFTGKDHTDLVDAIANCGPGNGISYSHLARALKAEGVSVGDKGVGHHINGECSCGPR